MSFSREISYTLPDSGSPSRIGYFDESSLAVIVTHPWGPLGGNMQNSVVLNVVQFFQRLKVTTMRFDFCGMQIGRGYSQIDQVKEAANVLLKGKFLSSDEQTHPKHILLVGYSYGSIICASATASIPECIGVIWIAPPLGVRRWLYLFAGNKHLAQAHKREDMPQLMIMGSKDNFTSVEDFERVVKAMPKDSTTSVVLEGSDHFFGRTAKDLLAAIGEDGYLCPTILFSCIYDFNHLHPNDLPYLPLFLVCVTMKTALWLMDVYPLHDRNIETLNSCDIPPVAMPEEETPSGSCLG